ncbi:aspartate aminotransferase family protein [Streptomyces sp. NRRL S-1022]|uniref:aspartate aminotransferase family protein n=1 Tax=Streptomyces sp. NRRL S-1022 TaxID=1463880 RepID=UPI0004C29454|nr:aminotransferase class III-fold pyridoxal phosphate-dependent enzyme [Streptomyces sp. NRRL S-1022]
MTDASNAPAEQPQLAEPHLGTVLASAGLDAEYVRAEGNLLYQRDEDGREIAVVDYAGGYGSLLLGHNHPAITAYAKELLESGIPVHSQFSLHPEAAELALALNRIIRRETGDDEPFYAVFANTGAEANEAALKHAELDRGVRLGALLEAVGSGLDAVRDAVRDGSATVPPEILARFGVDADLPGPAALDELIDRLGAHNEVEAGRPPVFLTPEGSFHGKLAGTVQLTHNEGYRLPFKALAAQARFVPLDQPGALRKIVDEERGTLFGLALEDGRVRLSEHETPVVCAFVLEPIQGEGGIRELSAEFGREIQEVCAEIGAPVVVDEIQSGMGRTGDFLASTRLGLRGDYYTLAKSLGGGLAKISVLLVRASRYHGEFELVHSSTFAKDGFSNRIALKVLELLEADDGAAYRTAAGLGERLLAMLGSVREDFPEVVKDVRGRGLLLGLEFHDQSGAPVPAIAEAAGAGLFGYLVAGHLLRGHRVRTFPTASAPNTLRFEPSILLSDDDIAWLETALRDTCDIVRGGYQRPLALPAG